MSHNTSAQDAPVASQEAEARYVVRFREDDPWPCYELVDTVTGSVLVDDGGEPEDRNLYRDFAPLVAELNRVAQLLTSERERYAALVEGVRALHNGHGGTICYSACHALAALEEAGSAQ